MSNQKIVFLTPNELKGLGINVPYTFMEDELDDLFPLVLDELKNIVRDCTIGSVEGSDIEFDVENSNCKVNLCIFINGKACKLHEDEWVGGISSINQLTVDRQIKVFQRLILQHQITLEDLAAEDIDNSVYKMLVVNELNGVEVCRRRLEELDRIWESQQEDARFTKMSEQVLNAL